MHKITPYIPGLVSFLIALFFLVFPAVAAALLITLFVLFGVFYCSIVYQLKASLTPTGEDAFSGYPTFKTVTIQMKQKVKL